MKKIDTTRPTGGSPLHVSVRFFFCNLTQPFLFPIRVSTPIFFGKPQLSGKDLLHRLAG